MQLGGPRRSGQQLAVARQGTLVLAESDPAQRLQHQAVAVTGKGGDQTLGLVQGLWVAIALEEDVGVFEARGVEIRRVPQCRLAQLLCVCQTVTRHGDARQQPQSLRIQAVTQQEGAQQLLGGPGLAIGQQSAGSDHFRRHALQGLCLRSRGGGAGTVAGQLAQSFEHAPAVDQRRIELDRAVERRERLGRPVQREVAVAPFLEHGPEARLQPLEPGEGGERGRHVTELALRHGTQ